MTYLSSAPHIPIVKQFLGDPLIHKYISILIGIIASVDGIAGLTENLLKIGDLSQFGTVFMWAGPAAFYGFNLLVNLIMMVVNF